MSNHGRWGVVILLAAGAPGPGAGQATADFANRYDRLRRANNQLLDTTAALTRQRLAGVAVDTLRTGALTVFARSTEIGHLRSVVDSAWGILRRTFGQHAEAIDGHPILLWPPNEEEGDRLAGQLHATLLNVPPGTDFDDLVDRVVVWVSPIPYRSSGVLQRWLPQPPLVSLLRTQPVNLYEELATAPWSAVRGCFAGDVMACRHALGITGTDPITQWYDATDRRRYEELLAPASQLSRSRVARCLHAGDDAACIELLRSSVRETESPFSLSARQLLLALAIDAGGANAFDRLVTVSSQPVDSMLAQASGWPIDTLVARWRARIIAAHPKTVAADARAAWAAVFWGVLFACVALRSAKWR